MWRICPGLWSLIPQGDTQGCVHSWDQLLLLACSELHMGCELGLAGPRVINTIVLLLCWPGLSYCFTV